MFSKRPSEGQSLPIGKVRRIALHGGGGAVYPASGHRWHLFKTGTVFWVYGFIWIEGHVYKSPSHWWTPMDLLLNCSVVSYSFETPWAVARQSPLSMERPRQEYWSGLPFPPPGNLPDPGIELKSPALQVNSLPVSHLGSPHVDWGLSIYLPQLLGSTLSPFSFRYSALRLQVVGQGFQFWNPVVAV